ncbi:glycosyltransferase family 2 protein [Clostridium tagluense]|uniref:glycosyltransferase family 2 protein n=1 Tax=Clostridium tagluense TaxID=360422 RepID=UPI001CF12E3D|nr:glycosyltransferase family 2 protein [Clostridium tagluense]MCB2296778.1 glycosyltransferase family 2 protein [Clostridium tagluense]
MLSYRIVIVNWNSDKQIRDCLKSINNIDMQGFVIDRVVVVDNASSDKSQEIYDTYNYNYEIIQNHENMGFAFACNQGAKGCNSDYILFLNPDTQLFQDTMVKLTSFLLTKDSTIGIVGIQLVDENGNISKTCSRFPTKRQRLCKILGITKLIPSTSANMQEWAHDESKVVDQVMGAFFVAEQVLFKRLNGFDERFFVYYEEVDFAKRAYNFGKKSYFFADSKAFHKGGGTSEQVLDKRLFYSLSSFLKYQKKHNGNMAIYIALLLELLEYLSRTILILFKSKNNNFSKLNSAYKMLLCNLKCILRD